MKRLAILVPIALCAVAIAHPNDDDATAHDFICANELGEVPTLNPDYRKPTTTLRGSGLTQDLDNIAILEDDGTFVVDGVTDFTPIVDAFYATHTDDYDQVFVYTSSAYPGLVDPEAGFAYHAHLSGFVAGVNDASQEIGTFATSRNLTRVMGVCNLNDLTRYPSDPTQDFTSNGQASGVEVLGHEFFHGWAAGAQPQNADVLAENSFHYSFYLHHPGGIGRASPLFGNIWQDNGGGSFTTIDSFTGFSQLDAWHMGLRAAGDVDPFYALSIPGGGPVSEYEPPAPGINVTGATRIDLTIADFEAVNGPRLPDATANAMKSFKVAFVLIIPNGVPAPQIDLDKLAAMRSEWNTYFESTTDNLGAMDTTLFYPAGSDPVADPFTDDFEGATVDANLWEWHQGPTIETLALNEPSGAQSMRLNGAWGSGDEIRSAMRDLSSIPTGAARLDCAVQRTGAGDSPEPDDDLFIEYFNSASEWVSLRTIAGAAPDQTDFDHFFDLLPADAYHEHFRFRFRRTQGELGDLDDYFVDDVSLTILTTTCLGDFDGDGVVGSSDLAQLIGDWGATGSPFDIDGGTVGASDLAALIGRWGPCP